MGVSGNLLLWISLALVASGSIEAQRTAYTPPPSGHSHRSTTPPPHGVNCGPTPPPAHHGGGGSYPSPPPITPATPVAPSPPVPVDPGSGSGPFPCTYWGSHPGLIWGVLGWYGTLGGAFGVPTLPGVPAGFTLPHALNSTGSDGYTSLYREGAASFLNSLAAPKRFPFTTRQVRASFVSALRSNKAAGHQAHLFHLANEGRLKL